MSTAMNRRALLAGTAATAALPADSRIFGKSAILSKAPSPRNVWVTQSFLAALIAERRRLSDAWIRDDINTADDVVEILYGEPMDALENQITSYRPNDIDEAVQAIDFILAEADGGTCELSDIRCGGWGADLYQLLSRARDAIAGLDTFASHASTDD